MFSLAQLLVESEADLFAENENRETPCDFAEKQHHKELALRLESQMVFSLSPEAEDIEAEYAALDRREVQKIIQGGRGWTLLVYHLSNKTCNTQILDIIMFYMLSPKLLAIKKVSIFSSYLLSKLLSSRFNLLKGIFKNVSGI